MAKLYITEYANNGRELKKNISQTASEPRLADQTIAIGASSAQSSALNAKTRIVRLHTDAICSVAVGDNPTATANAFRMAANQTEYIAVSDDLFLNGAAPKIAVITNV